MIIHEPNITYIKKEIVGIQLVDADSTVKHLREFMEINCDPTIETCVLIGINKKNFVLFTKILTIGTDSQCLLTPRQIFKECLLNNSTGFIISHNHPSGDPSPSNADMKVTRQIREAAEIMGISFVDHVIIGEKENHEGGVGYYSMREAGII